MTSKFHSVIYVIFSIQENVNRKLHRYVYDLSPYQTSHVWIHSLVSTIKCKAKYSFHMVILFYIIYKTDPDAKER